MLNVPPNMADLTSMKHAVSSLNDSESQSFITVHGNTTIWAIITEWGQTLSHISSKDTQMGSVYATPLNSKSYVLVRMNRTKLCLRHINHFEANFVIMLEYLSKTSKRNMFLIWNKLKSKSKYSYMCCNFAVIIKLQCLATDVFWSFCLETW